MPRLCLTNCHLFHLVQSCRVKSAIQKLQTISFINNAFEMQVKKINNNVRIIFIRFHNFFLFNPKFIEVVKFNTVFLPAEIFYFRPNTQIIERIYLGNIYLDIFILCDYITALLFVKIRRFFLRQIQFSSFLKVPGARQKSIYLILWKKL